ncbi:hypothetical protein IJH89_00580 [Candidatus Saccharibacteria bacterium]|nr:hypothetical protein [Candidatus Saccharibacteria bacterium]
MKEKLYFEPSGSKKDKKKKRQTGQRVEKSADKKNHRALKLICLLLFLLVFILIIIWLLRGKTVTTGAYPANIKNESLECSSTEVAYNKLGNFDIRPQETQLTFTAVFSSDDELRSLSLKDLMVFADNSEAIVAEARSHANFNTSLHAYNYSIGKFDNKFSIMGNKLLVTLAVKSKEFDEFSKDYFLISSETLPTSLADFRKNYESQGFSCRINESQQTNL